MPYERETKEYNWNGKREGEKTDDRMKGEEGVAHLGDNSSPLHESDQAPGQRFTTRVEKRKKKQPNFITSSILFA